MRGPCAIADRFRSDVPPLFHQQHTRRLNHETDENRHQAETCRARGRVAQDRKLKADKTSLEKTLDADFEQNEVAYRNGIATDNGILIRKPSWKSVAKPVVEVA